MKTPVNKIAFFLSLFIVIGCGIKDKKTTLEIIDADRHYHPVMRGEVLDIVYQLENTGSNPLFIDDIKTSCGCLIVDESSFKVLPAGGKGFIRIKYDSAKNIGYVKHYVSIYANLEAGSLREVTFDLNVVPNALYTKDYEELHREKQPTEKLLVDGTPQQLGYYIDDIPW